MSGKTKIYVLHMKELIYTAIFALLAIILIVLLSVMFLSEPKSKNKEAKYIPGVYNTSLTLNNQNVDLKIVVDENNINSISLVNTDETITTMFPLIESTLGSITEQIYKNQSLDNISYNENNRYTATVLIDAINETLSKATLHP